MSIELLLRASPCGFHMYVPMEGPGAKVFPGGLVKNFVPGQKKPLKVLVLGSIGAYICTLQNWEPVWSVSGRFFSPVFFEKSFGGSKKGGIFAPALGRKSRGRHRKSS